MHKILRQLAAIGKQTRRNLAHTLGTQLVVLGTVMLAVLIFGFFALISLNLARAGKDLDRHVRFIAFFDQEQPQAARRQLIQRIQAAMPESHIVYVDKKTAWRRLAERLGGERAILDDLGPDFLPAALEIQPGQRLVTVEELDTFAAFLRTLPGVASVRYGRGWLVRFMAFSRLLRVVTLLSGLLLVLTSTFTIAATIRLTIANRRHEIEVLNLLGASAAYIRLPLMAEGLFHGLAGSALGLAILTGLHRWVLTHFGSQALFLSFHPVFLAPAHLLLIVAATTLLCLLGSLVSIQRCLRAS